MTYEYQAKAGYYGAGAWVIYGRPDCWGYRRAQMFCSTEQEAIDWIAAH